MEELQTNRSMFPINLHFVSIVYTEELNLNFMVDFDAKSGRDRKRNRALKMAKEP